MKPKQIGRYEIKEVCGEGSFGKVYRGIEAVTLEEVALKFISRKGKSKKQIDKQKQEIEILKKLKHEHIIFLKQFIETDNQLIVVTEFAGKDLASVLEKQKKLPLEEIRQYAKQILSALLYLHDHRIVHRDLKPQNILIKNGKAKLCDFGFARKMSAATVCLYSLKGTPLYIAPQIIGDKPYNHKIDIWSLGIILYELFCGQPPFYADSYYKLLPKILHDKVKYPSGMDLTLKELIEGMLQKSAPSRYDYAHIMSHPFLQQKQVSILKQNKIDNNRVNIHNPLKQQLGKIEEEDEFDKSYRTSRNPSKLRPNKYKLNFEELKGYEDDIRQMRTNLKTLKTDFVFYNRLVSLFTLYTLDSQITKDCLCSALRVIIGLIMKVKLQTNEQKESDITRKPELLMSVIKLIQNVGDDDGLISQCYSAICYLLKSNFNPSEINMEAAEEIISASVVTLKREKVSNGLFTNLLYVIGTLAAQALTIQHSDEFYSMVLQHKLLTMIPKRMVIENSAVVVCCLKKLLHPAKGEDKSLKSTKIINELKLQTANGFTSQNMSHFSRISDTLPATQLVIFYEIIYQCVKFSHQFRKLLINSKILGLIKSDKFLLSINYYMLKCEGVCFCDFQKIKTSILNQTDFVSPISSAFQFSMLCKYLQKNDPKQVVQHLNTLWKKMNKLLQISNYKKVKQIELIQGWAFGKPSLKFNDVITEGFISLYECSKWGNQGSVIFNSSNLSKLYQALFCNSDSLLSSDTFIRLVPCIISSSKQRSLDRKITSSVIDILVGVLSDKQLTSLRQVQSREYMRVYMKESLELIVEVILKDDVKMIQFFSKAISINLHQSLISFLEDDKLAMLIIPILSKMLQQKSGTDIVQDIVMLGLPKMKKHLQTPDTNLVIEVINIISMVGRSDVSFYPCIANTGIVQLIPSYLSHQNDLLKQKTINLVGNIAKHSKYFFSDFSKYSIITSIVNSLSKSSNFERMIKNVVYAIGNISFYSDQFYLQIRPLVPYFAACLQLDADYLIQNTMSTLSNLVRHSPVYIKDIISCGIFKRVLQLSISYKSVKIIQLSLNFIMKAVQYEQIVNMYRQSIQKVVKGIKVSDGEVSKRLVKIQQKLY